jgi:hypothetical protein
MDCTIDELAHAAHEARAPAPDHLFRREMNHPRGLRIHYMLTLATISNLQCT